MRLKIALTAVIISLLFFVCGAAAQEANLGVCYRGQLYDLTGIVDKGVAAGNINEIAKILGAEVVSIGQSEATMVIGKIKVQLPLIFKWDSESYVPLRQLGQQLGECIYWEEKTESVLMANQGSCPVFEEDYTVLTKLLSHDWMRVQSKNELYKFFVPLLAGDLLEQVTENSWEFVTQATDWDADYYLKTVKPIAAGANWRALLAEITEENIIQGKRTGHGLFIFTKQEGGDWRVTAMRYNWPENKS